MVLIHISVSKSVSKCFSDSHQDLSLSCKDFGVIEIDSVMRGKTETEVCTEDTRASCIENVNHHDQILQLCEGREHCTVPLVGEKLEMCAGEDSNYSHITYECIPGEFRNIFIKYFDHSKITL